MIEAQKISFKLGSCEILKNRKVQCTFVFGHMYHRTINASFNKNMEYSFMIDDLGNRSGLVGRTTILIDKGQPFPPNMDIAGRITWDKLAEEAATVSFSVDLHNLATMLFPAITLKAL